MISAKPKCLHCRKRFTPEEARLRLHPDCIDPWMTAYALKRDAKKAKTEKAKDRATRERLKTIPKLIKEAQVEFNRFIRERDADRPCISCGTPPPNLASLHAGRDAGHYRSIGSAAHLRYDERNCHAQCVHCNQWKAGNAVDYRIGLVARIGATAVASLESDNAPVKWDRDTLRQLKVIYRAKYRALLKERGE